MVKIYKITSPVKPFEIYIGATTTTLNSRLSQHKWDANNKKNKKSKWLKDLLDLNALVFIELLEEVKLEDYQSKEEFYINDSISKGLSVANFRLNSTGIVLGRSDESIQRSSTAKYIPILQIDPKTKETIKEWSSSKEASEYFGFKTHSSIVNVLKGWSETCGGYIWEYKNKENNKTLKKKRSYSIVQVLNKETNVIQIYNSGESVYFICQCLGLNPVKNKVSNYIANYKKFEIDKFVITVQ